MDERFLTVFRDMYIIVLAGAWIQEVPCCQEQGDCPTESNQESGPRRIGMLIYC